MMTCTLFGRRSIPFFETQNRNFCTKQLHECKTIRKRPLFFVKSELLGQPNSPFSLRNVCESF